MDVKVRKAEKLVHNNLTSGAIVCVPEFFNVQGKKEKEDVPVTTKLCVTISIPTVLTEQTGLPTSDWVLRTWGRQLPRTYVVINSNKTHLDRRSSRDGS